MSLFVIALETVVNAAFYEAYAKPEIKEMQELYDIYTELNYYYDESILLFSLLESINKDIFDTLTQINYASLDNGQASANGLSKKYKDYLTNMDICIVDSNNIVHLFRENSLSDAEVKKHDQEHGLEFVIEADVIQFLADNEIIKENDTYSSNNIIISKLKSHEEVYVVGIPRYDKIFDFCTNSIVIYNKHGHEELRLNTKSIEKKISLNRITRGKSYQTFSVGKYRTMLCYYSNEDERGDYCLSLVNNLDLGYRYTIYAFLLVFFAIVSIAFWYWSEKITKPLDFFLMWIKLIKDKGTLKEDEKAHKPMPKENYLLQNNIMVFFSFCLVPIIFAGAVQWYSENQILNRYVEQRYVQSAEFSGNIFDEKYNIWRDPITLLGKDERIIECLVEAQMDDGSDKPILRYLNEYSKLISDESDVLTMYDVDGNVVVSSANDFEQDKYIRYRVNVNESYKWSFAEGLKRFILHQKIYNTKGNIIGYCKLELKEPSLNAATYYNRDYLYSCYIYKYTDKIYNLLGSPSISDEEIINMIRSNKTYSLAKSVVLEKANINLFYIVKEKIFFDIVWGKHVLSFMNAVFFLIIALIFSASFLTRMTLNPIIQISNALYKDSPQVPMSTLLLGKEEFDLIVNRVKTLSEQVNTYAQEQKLLEAERHEHEKKRKDAEILTLQTQINPHFMYNIFSSIGVLIRTGETEKATKMVTYTGNLMRMGLYRGHVMIHLKEELEHVFQYINIQQIRYHNCMNINVNVDEGLMHLKVVKFILQPIVENAIEHNIGYLEDRDLKIDINAYIKDEHLIIQVVDNGTGMDSEQIVCLQSSIDSFDMSSHLGLANINERIKLNCGDEYGVKLSKNNECGLRVELVLPVVLEKEE